MKKIILFAAYALIAACGQAENWPDHKVSEVQENLAKSNAEKYIAMKLDARARSQDYSSNGDYLNYGSTVHHRESERMKIDDDGVPLVLQGKRFHYSPVTVAIAALAEHGRYLQSNDPVKFLAAANRLLSMTGEDGALRYPYIYRHYTTLQSLAPGWTSGMAQGMALSVFSRAYLVTQKDKWIEAGDRVFRFLETPFPDGPKSNLSDLDKTLSKYPFYLEYPSNPNAFTLNGYMFTLLGIYDWSQIKDGSEAENSFFRGINTLEKVLPYYDLNGFSAYDLSYMTYSKDKFLIPRRPHFAPRYHAVHISQLRALYSITANENLRSTAEKWQSYVER